MKLSLRSIATECSLAALLLVLACGLTSPVDAQERSAAPTEEVVANLAAGRVIVAVVKGAIIVATIEDPIEAETHPPIPVELKDDRLGVILGAVEWLSPSSQQRIGRLDQELPELRSQNMRQTPSLRPSQGGAEATDLEVTGDALRVRLNDLAQSLHSKISLPSKEPIADLIIADYLGGYGPEVWQLSYQMKQTSDKSDYWTTEIEKPVYLQFWPPEPNKPRTLMEFAYPPEEMSQTLLELLRQRDSRLEKLISSDPKMVAVEAQFIQGESSKVETADAVQFLRLILAAFALPRVRETMAVIGEQSGFRWIIQPPAEPSKPAAAQPRAPGAPTLRRPTNP